MRYHDGMHVNDLSDRTQDYLRALWDYEEHNPGPVPLSEISRRTGQKASTASEAIKRLATDGLVSHAPYSGVELTNQGRILAAQMVRRHRLMETFLVTVLGYTWDEVDEDAELLEHSMSDRFIQRVAQYLGNPTRDPHGDPIPREDGTVEAVSTRTLADITTDGASARVEQVDDEDPELLRYLSTAGIAPGTTLTVVNRAAGLMNVTVGDKEFALSETSLKDIRISE